MDGGETGTETSRKRQEFIGEAQERAKSAISNQKGRAAESLGSVAQAFRKAGEQLREGDQGMVANYADRAAEGVQQFSSYLREHNIEDLVKDTEEMARRRPLAFMGGAFALGFVLARFFRDGGGACSVHETGQHTEKESYSGDKSTTAGPCT